LPFTINSQSNYFPICAIVWEGGASWTFPVGTTTLSIMGDGGTTTAQIRAAGSATAGNYVQMANASLIVFYTLTYQM
jgi:hypothetical protein